ncbi:RNA polymerase sigma factor [Hyphococcus sp. DH-69]|uniref:RNA polymerase sigma factor n=1 Tax=Hyphococcus formosus TaxID=3143534 RepID=UPI00398AC873
MIKKTLVVRDKPTASDLESRTDNQLVQQVLAQNDATAFELIMRRHNQRLYRLARSILKDADDAEDVVQETYLRAFQKLESFRADSELSTWLSRIAINTAYRRLRRRGRVVFFEDFASPKNEGDDPHPAFIEGVESEEPSPEFQMQITQLRSLLQEAIDMLPLEFRTVFVLAKVDGRSVKEIATILSINEQTVKTRLHRAKAKLRTNIGDAFEDIAPSVHQFDGARCDRIVASVLIALTNS